ncbi:PREDICTED: uridine phosphorylase 1-like [Priapulus caudatus]|uniref:Uridine phosphorylase 1-like n=1 Tax=Priapulus caudatus TaxID=37621 RepID=A0ABM1DQB7_PRICU|nr:PREDICTED: uridine phosphorylase 1-like [Priapulus caudatus]
MGFITTKQRARDVLFWPGMNKQIEKMIISVRYCTSTEVQPSRMTDSKNDEHEKDNRFVVKLKNPHLKTMTEDVLYHFTLSTSTHDLQDMFGDVKFVCCSGSPKRIAVFAEYIRDELSIKLPVGCTLENIANKTDRYALYKIGPVLAVSHGMGMPSVSIMLHEILKLVYYAKCKDVTFIRIGTSGGIGLDAGTVVVSDKVVDGRFRPVFEVPILGKVVARPAILHPQIANDLLHCKKPDDVFKIVVGTTMCTLDFYEGQARVDGAFCNYTEQDKKEFLQSAYAQGVRNMEMESLCFAATLHHADIKCAVVCVTLLDRMHGDQISMSHDEYEEFQVRPQRVVARFMRRKLRLGSQASCDE